MTTVEQLHQEWKDKKHVTDIIGPQKLFKSNVTVHWSEMSGKMFGKRAIGRPTTSRCTDRQLIDGSICQKCYAVNHVNKMYPLMNNAMQRNRDIDIEDIYRSPPLFTDVDPTWRSNWNGDYSDEHDVLVDFALCNTIPESICSVWTKNIDLIENCKFEEDNPPNNFTVIQSSLMIDCVDDYISPNSDQVFTIYTAEHAVENDIEINCIGACRLCNRCYGIMDGHRPRLVNELLKGDEAKYFKLMGVVE